MMFFTYSAITYSQEIPAEDTVMIEEAASEMTGFEDNDLTEVAELQLMENEELQLMENAELQLTEAAEPDSEENTGTIEVYIQKLVWYWGEYLGNISDDTVSVGLYLDEEGTELYGSTQMICFEDNDVQFAYFKHVPCGTYYVLLSDADGIVHKEYSCWDRYYSWSDEEHGYEEFHYEVDEDSIQVVQITPDALSAQINFILKSEHVVPGYSYSGKIHLNVTCWDSEHKNKIEPEEDIPIGLFRNGDEDYDRVFPYLYFDATMTSPLLIADQGITAYDIYFMKEENGGYVKADEEDYIVTGDRHFEFNSDEGLYEAEIYLELQEKAKDAPEPIVSPEPTTSPEGIPTVTPEPTVTQAPTVHLESTVTQAPTATPEPTTTQTATANVVNTGDESSVRLYLTLMMIALAGMTGVFGKKKKI